METKMMAKERERERMNGMDGKRERERERRRSEVGTKEGKSERGRTAKNRVW